MRIDLVGSPAGAQWPPIFEALAHSEVSSVAVVLFNSEVAGDPRQDPGLAGWAAASREALELGGYCVVDVLIATATSWWSMVCESEDCCPPAGTARQRGCSTVAAQATVAGLVALPDRASLAASLGGDSQATRRALAPHIAAAELRLARAAETGTLPRALAADLALLRRRARMGAPERPAVSGRQLARIGVALADITVRDEVWLAVDDGALDLRDCLLELLRRLPAPLDVAPLFLYGWLQWRNGNGTLATMCAERALGHDPGYTGARLLLTAVQTGMNPQTTPPLNSAGTSDPA